MQVKLSDLISCATTIAYEDIKKETNLLINEEWYSILNVYQKDKILFVEPTQWFNESQDSFIIDEKYFSFNTVWFDKITFG